MANSYDPYSYQQILHDRIAFRQAGGPQSNEFNMADTPGIQFFRILFHFYSQESANFIGGYGLLHPTWEVIGSGFTNKTLTNLDGVSGDQKYWEYSTAYSYLKMNGEDERAEYLKNFICLLSNINTFSPWYWKSVKGLNTVTEKKIANVGEVVKFGDRKKITIECLPDAVDNRIRTLIDLYRSAVWSWRTKREIVPSNLRKFDMTICLMQAPIRGIHTPNELGVKITDFFGAASKWINTGSSDYASSMPVGARESSHHISTYKIFELHGCEFDYTMGSDAYGQISNQDGFQPEYSIPIFVEDAVEYSYNEFAPQLDEYGDMVAIDTNEHIYNDYAEVRAQITTDTARMSAAAANYTRKLNLLNKSLTAAEKGDTKKSTRYLEQAEGISINSSNTDAFNFPETDSDISSRIDAAQNSSVTGQLLSFLSSKVSNKTSKVALGNLFGFSINRTVEAIQDLARGNVSSTLARFIESRREKNAENYYGLKEFDSDKKLTGLNVGDAGCGREYGVGTIEGPYRQMGNEEESSKQYSDRHTGVLNARDFHGNIDAIISKDRTVQLGNLFTNNTLKNNL